MAIREIAASFEVVCDCCRETETMTSKHRPKYWSDFNILRDAYDFQGHAVADGSVKLLLCLKCSDAVAKAVNNTVDDLRAAIAKATGGEA